MTMEYKQLSNTGLKISAIGLGGMPMSLSGRPSEEDSIKVIHRALDLGVNFIDTADAYCIDESEKHHNERLIAKALKTYKGKANVDDVVIATKGGFMRPNKDEWVRNGDPNHLRRTIRESFEALGGVKPIDLWQYHAIDPNFTIEQSLSVVKEAVDQGLIKQVGVSNFKVADIERAKKVLPIVSVQNQYNPKWRKHEKEGVIEYCEKNNLIFLPWSPVGGMWAYKQLVEIKPLADLAQAKGCTVYSLVLAWIKQKSPCVVAIPGASKVSSIENSVESLKIKLTKEEMDQMDRISDTLPPAAFDVE